MHACMHTYMHTYRETETDRPTDGRACLCSCTIMQHAFTDAHAQNMWCDLINRDDAEQLKWVLEPEAAERPAPGSFCSESVGQGRPPRNSSRALTHSYWHLSKTVRDQLEQKQLLGCLLRLMRLLSSGSVSQREDPCLQLRLRHARPAWTGKSLPSLSGGCKSGSSLFFRCTANTRGVGGATAHDTDRHTSVAQLHGLSHGVHRPSSLAPFAALCQHFCRVQWYSLQNTEDSEQGVQQQSCHADKDDTENRWQSMMPNTLKMT